MGHSCCACWDASACGCGSHYQKYREEFEHHGVVVTIDETPIGTFVELEGDEQGIIRIAHALGRAPEEFVLDSYRGLFVKAQEAGRGDSVTDMIFDTPP